MPSQSFDVPLFQQTLTMRLVDDRYYRRDAILFGVFVWVWSRNEVQCFQQRATTGFLFPSLRSQYHRAQNCFFRQLRLKNKDGFDAEINQSQEGNKLDASRRRTLQSFVATAAVTASIPLQVARAGIAELDSSGNLYSPKAEMLSGGSSAARGIPVTGSRVRLQDGQALQSIYETRFVAYLSRFLLNFDPGARAWWLKQGLGDSWDQMPQDGEDAADSSIVFCEFAESVEVGLADYFSGPFGSYSSVSAATAGILAAQPAKSVQAQGPDSLVDRIFGRRNNRKVASSKASTYDDDLSLAKQGVLNLYTLLKARYTSLAAKRQLAILFSFISNPALQPVNEIRSLLGEADNATVSQISVSRASVNEVDSRTSSRRGGGYTLGTFPQVQVDAPPPLGDEFQPANVRPVMRSTSRVLSITVLDGGEGYTSSPPPVVSVIQSGYRKPCQATAILDREGHVASILVLDPGYGYGGRTGELAPKIVIEKPKTTKKKSKEDVPLRRAMAVADMEYEIAGVDVLDGGNGFVRTEPPKVKITPPDDDPDWFLYVQEQPEMRMIPVRDEFNIEAEVSEMTYPDGNVAFSTSMKPMRSLMLDEGLLERIRRDPLELIPSSMRPLLIRAPEDGKAIYQIPALALIASNVGTVSPRYRTYDYLFGGVGRVPVTKGASALSVSEYARLALSGAVCTVVVRTLLNPLELIKTKQQLENDVELLSFTRATLHGKDTTQDEKSVGSTPGELFGSNAPQSQPMLATEASGAVAVQPNVAVESEAAATQKKEAKIGTLDLIKGTIELRGLSSLFQSTDITFLASLMFGSFGFGATELFRRSFASFFSPEGDGGSELVLLFAAAVATVVTAAVASPFEVLRVRSMGLVEPRQWTTVLEDFLVCLRRYLRRVYKGSALTHIFCPALLSLDRKGQK